MAVLLPILTFAGAVLGALALILYQHLTRRRLRLGYLRLSEAPLVPFETKPGDGLRVIVKKELLPTHLQDEDEGEYQDAGTVYGFRILLKNTGTQTIKGDDQSPGLDVIFQLDEWANILAIDVESPPLGPNDFVKEEHYQGMPHTARLWLKYLNEDREIVVSIQSVGNLELTCNVDAKAPDLPPAYDIREAERRIFLIRSAILFAIAVTPLLVGIIWGISLYGANLSDAEREADTPRSTVIYGLQLGGSAWAGFWLIITGIFRLIERRVSRSEHTEGAEGD